VATYEAEWLVITAGAWAPALLADLSLSLQPGRVIYWFEPEGGTEPFLPDSFPVFIWELDEGNTFSCFPLLTGERAESPPVLVHPFVCVPLVGGELSEHAHGRQTSLSGEAIDHPQGVLDLLARSIPASDPPDERLGHEGYGVCYDPVQRTQSRPISLSGVPFPYLHLLAFYHTVCKIGVEEVRTGMIRADGRFSDSNSDQEIR